jgi:endoglucanase
VGVRKIRGFWTNDTHEDWTINEVRWGERVSRLTHGAQFIVNTATNGQGPLIPADRVHHGNEVLCNPPGRGTGPLPRVNPGYRDVDAFLWTAPPGNSSGACNGGPAAGTFWPAKAIGMAARANGRLGPGFPSQPY